MNRAVPWPRFFFDRSNPIESMDDIMLFRRYRFRRETMVEIVGLCGDAAKATKSTLKSQKPESVSEVCDNVSEYGPWIHRNCSHTTC